MYTLRITTRDSKLIVRKTTAKIILRNVSSRLVLRNVTQKIKVGASVKRGLKGEAGEQGPQGLQGIQGPIGPSGPTGLKGEDGAKGTTGDRGIQGERGLTGSTGATGSMGPQGPAGLRGKDGPQGIQGVKGDTGLAGATGPKGDTGAPGTTDYNELLNKPDFTLKADKTYVNAQDAALQDAINTKQPVGDYATNTALTSGLATKADTSSLAPVATSGDYTDLTNKPTIPNASGTNTGDQVGDGVTITGAGTELDPFVSVNEVIWGGIAGDIAVQEDLNTLLSERIPEQTLFIQNNEPTVTSPSLWVETASGAAKTIWMVT